MHPPAGPAWLVWLETSAVAEAMRQWAWLYPIVEVAHIVGFVILVGAAFMFDLRLLGVSPALPVTGLERHLLRAARVSVALVVPSGLLMFTAHATEMADNPAFRLKMVLLAAAGLNAALFHRAPFRSVASWNEYAPAPAAARAAAIASLLLWTSVITCGRLLAYL
jgi:hypothetical protein